MKHLKDFNNYGINNINNSMNEKWNEDVKIKKTGEHADKTIDELEDELKNLKRKSARYQKEGNTVPKKIKEKESEINFAIRAKRNWK